MRKNMSKMNWKVWTSWGWARPNQLKGQSCLEFPFGGAAGHGGGQGGNMTILGTEKNHSLAFFFAQKGLFHANNPFLNR